MSQIAVNRLKLWRERPDVFVREVFKATPDPWQDEVLKAFPHNQRICMKASKGPGKSCIEAWLAWNFLVTRPFPKIAATSISGDNLRDGLWTEMAKWREVSPLLKETFVWQKERIFAKDYPETWWMAARQWSKSADPNTIGNTLAGLHADYIMFVLDESGGMPEAIMASAEAALSSCIEGHIIQAGNPTHLEGPLYNACYRDRGLWYVVEITSDPDNPNRSPRVKPEWAREQIQKYGRENPWVLVNVFGQFPPASFNALIGPDEINSAIKRRYKEVEFAESPRLLGIDVARFGDDSSIIFPRQGLQAFTPMEYRNINGTQGAEIVTRKWNDWDADGCFIDNTGGFGASWIDNLVRLGKSPIGVHFSETQGIDPQYYNKRAEMAFKLIEWIKAGGALPDVLELTQALTQTTYTFKGEQIIIEPKDDLKSKLGFSPDHMDALMLTFALPIEKTRTVNRSQSFHQIEYNPFSREKVLGYG
jgi:phage terminase large subunit